MRKKKKQLTIKDLLAQKEQLQQRKKQTETLYVKFLDAEIVIQEPSRALALETIEMANDPETKEVADIHVVYHSVIEPNLKDEELQKQFGCIEPTDIVTAIFRAGDITTISNYALNLAGYGKGITKVDKAIKN